MPYCHDQNQIKIILPNFKDVYLINFINFFLKKKLRVNNDNSGNINYIQKNRRHVMNYPIFRSLYLTYPVNISAASKLSMSMKITNILQAIVRWRTFY